MNTSLPLLSCILWLPVVAGALMLATSKCKFWLGRSRNLAILISLASLALVAQALLNFDLANSGMQFAEHVPWLPDLDIEYGLGVDGFAILLVALTAFMTLLVIIAAFSQMPAAQFSSYCGTFFIMQGLMCGVFMSLDAVLFYVFFEAMMIPMFLLIGIWGGPNRVYATLKFILYTFLGSLFLLVAILYLHHVASKQGLTGTETFAISSWHDLQLNLRQQQWLFWAMLLAFAVKVPMWPVHTWLPDAHVEAPTGGSIILAAITLKIGGYGMLRLLLPIVPNACQYFADLMIILSLVAIVYISLVAIVQQDLKKLIAYSSIAHMGFVTLGIFVAVKIMRGSQIVGDAALGVDGAMLQMISHGFISGALFLCVGVLYVRMHSRKIADYGGVVNSMPIFASFFMLFALANVGMPGTSGFVGEFLVILATFKVSFWAAVFAGTMLILGVSYTLWMYKRVMFGEVVSDTVAALKDLTINEKLAFVLLTGAVMLFGIWPQPLLDVMRSSSNKLVTQLLR